VLFSFQKVAPIQECFHSQGTNGGSSVAQHSTHNLKVRGLNFILSALSPSPGNTKGHHCTIDLLFDWFGSSCMITDNFSFYLQSRLIQTGQTGGQWYIDTSPFSIPCLVLPDYAGFFSAVAFHLLGTRGTYSQNFLGYVSTKVLKNVRC
jgi:hypothetical protein